MNILTSNDLSNTNSLETENFQGLSKKNNCPKLDGSSET